MKVYDSDVSDVECRVCDLWARNTIWGLGLRRTGSGFGIFGGWGWNLEPTWKLGVIGLGLRFRV